MDANTRMMKILDLPLKSAWYLMIESGVKKEEYREITEYWQKRLMQCYAKSYCRHRICSECIDIPFLCVNKPFDAIRFRYGYTRRTMLFKLDSISIGKGDPEWGAPDNKVFILKLGERINEL